MSKITKKSIEVSVNFKSLKKRRKEMGEKQFIERYKKFFDDVLNEIIKNTKWKTMKNN